MDYEHLPGDGPLDETDVSLRGYLANLSDEHLAEYDPAWSDEQVLAWNGNFRSDGALMLVCCERDIDVTDFRRALEEHLRFRRPQRQNSATLSSFAFLATSLWLALAASLANAGDEWPQFRGQHAAGVADGKQLPDTWSTTKNVAWQAEIPGHGWSSPIVWGGRVFVTSFVSAEKVVVPKSGFYAPRDVKIPAGEHRWTVFCLDAKSGKVLWEQAAHTGKPDHSIHVKASYAAETPVTDGERLYVYFGNVGLFCYDLAGKVLWSRTWGSFPTRLGWGTGASPTLHGDRVYLVNDNEQESFITALDKRTGDVIWRIPRDEKSSWATPFVWENGIRTEIVTCATSKVRSYGLDGKLLWEFGPMSSICVPTPITAGELLILNSGYEFGQPRPLFAVRPGASGDISLQGNEPSNQFVAWHRAAGCYHPTPLYYNNQLYVLYSTGLVACFDPLTGAEIFGKQRLGGSFTASPWAADGKIYCLNEDGDTFVLDAGREFKLLGTNSLNEMCMATPAMTDRGLFVRTLTRLYCLRLFNALGQEPKATAARQTATAAANTRPNMVGAYGPWLADSVLGDGPARLSYRTGNWKTVDEWRKAARARVLECMAPVDLGGGPEVRVDSTHEFDGLRIERLSWQLPGGPRSEAVFLKPAGTQGRLPAILALHDHGGNKFLGWRKITRIDDSPWPIIVDHQQRYYGGVAWANEIAKRGYAVLIHDTFPFASRRVRVDEVPDRLKQNGVDPEPTDEEGIKRYNAFASAHEHIMEKSLISAGTTWPGVYVVEDQRALDVLCARPDVDASRVGCCGLSGGGMRTVFLGGLDDRIRCAIAVGFMTTWREFLLDKCFTHTWMTYVPLLPRDLDFPEILALRAPAATMVLNCNEDALYTVPEMRRADAMMRETFEKAGAADKYRCNFYSGGHKFDLEMQTDAFNWFDQHLKPRIP